MVSRYTHQGYGEMFEHYDGDPVQPGDKIYYAEDDYQALAAELAVERQQHNECCRDYVQAEARVKALEADRDQISLTLAVAKVDRDKWFNRSKALEAHIEKWVFVTALQTFEDRERFRTESEKLLYSAPETPAKSPPTFTGWINSACENCGKLAGSHIGLSMACYEADRASK